MEITNISESFTVHALVDSDVIEVFIDKSFIEKHHLNTYKLSKTVPVYNVNKISNKIGQISKVVDVVLYYKNMPKRYFLQSLALENKISFLGLPSLSNII